jgi:hypothetical protein
MFVATEVNKHAVKNQDGERSASGPNCSFPRWVGIVPGGVLRLLTLASLGRIVPLG